MKTGSLPGEGAGNAISETIKHTYMKKPVKRILRGTLIFFGIIFLIVLYFGLRFWIGTRDMTPAETQKINDSVYCVKDRFVNAYIFRTGADYVLVDAGNDAAGFKSGLDQLGISPDAVTAVLLTHTDGDHIGAMSLFPKAKVYMHRDEEQMINGKNGKFFFLRFHWKYQPYILLNDRDTLRIGTLPVKIIHTPGHTPGSCCWLIGNDYLCTGDNTVAKNGKFVHFTGFFNVDTEIQEEALKKVPELYSTPVILMAHHGILRQKPSAVINTK